MKKIFFLILLFLTAHIYAQDSKMELVNKLILEVKNQFAPDKRVAIFNIEAHSYEDKIILKGETNLLNAFSLLKANLFSNNFKIADEVKLLPASELGEHTYGLVTLSVANIRTKPDHAEELSTQALLGTPVKVFQKKSGYYLIQTPDEYISWVDDDGIALKTKTEIDNWTAAEKIVYMKEFGFAYSKPDINSLRVSDLAAGNILELIGENSVFAKVKYPDGRIGFVEKDFTMDFHQWLERKTPTEKDIIETAEKFMGIPYLWGGTSAKGMDCSGFTKTVYFLNGIVLARDASQQVHNGILVNTENGFENLNTGDLLFFGFHATDSTKERITHVGIYQGSNEFIHEAGRVKVNSFDKNAHNFSEFRLLHFIRARRIINSIDHNGIQSVKKNKFYRGEF